MGSHPLISARAKLRRADLHIQHFKTALGDAFNGKEPWTLYKELSEDQRRFTQYVDQLNITEDQLLDIGCLAGDAMLCLRSALDHLAWSLVGLGRKAGKLTQEAASKVQFPIQSDGDDKIFRASACSNWLPGVDPTFISIVRRYQPYKSGNPTLSALRHFTNDDKHRVVTPTLIRGKQVFIEVLEETIRNCILERTELPQQTGPLGHGAELFSAYVIPLGTGTPDLKMKSTLFPAISLEGGHDWAEEMLTGARGLVCTILDEFEPLLEKGAAHGLPPSRG